MCVCLYVCIIIRNLEHSTILYEDQKQQPLLRLAWNRQDPNYLSTFAVDSSEVQIGEGKGRRGGEGRERAGGEGRGGKGGRGGAGGVGQIQGERREGGLINV